MCVCVCVCGRMNLREITENVKLAREYALLGNYSSASVLYRGVLTQLQRHLLGLRDGGFTHRWQQVSPAHRWIGEPRPPGDRGSPRPPRDR